MTMSSFFDDMTFDLNHASMPDVPGVPYGWQATADNKVKRHQDETPSTPRATLGVGGAADAVNAQVRLTEQKLNVLRTQAREASVTADGLLVTVEGMADVLRAPGSELAKALEAIAELEQKNASIVKEAQRQKKRADAAERRAEDLDAALQRANKADVEKLQAAAPGDAFIIRRRTPGDSIRYLSSEVMKHAQDNMDLAGVAIALRMTAAEIDDLPQGDHAR